MQGSELQHEPGVDIFPPSGVCTSPYSVQASIDSSHDPLPEDGLTLHLTNAPDGPRVLECQRHTAQSVRAVVPSYAEVFSVGLIHRAHDPVSAELVLRTSDSRSFRWTFEWQHPDFGGTVAMMRVEAMLSQVMRRQMEADEQDFEQKVLEAAAGSVKLTVTLLLRRIGRAVWWEACVHCSG